MAPTGADTRPGVVGWTNRFRHLEGPLPPNEQGSFKSIQRVLSHTCSGRHSNCPKLPSHPCLFFTEHRRLDSDLLQVRCCDVPSVLRGIVKRVGTLTQQRSLSSTARPASSMGEGYDEAVHLARDPVEPLGCRGRITEQSLRSVGEFRSVHIRFDAVE